MSIPFTTNFNKFLKIVYKASKRLDGITYRSYGKGVEITVIRADLSNADTGGGYREIVCNVTIDDTQSPWQQRQAVIYEALSALFPSVSHEYILDACETLGEALDQLGIE